MIDHPAAVPVMPPSARAAMARMQAPWASDAPAQNPLRIGTRRITPPTRICGSSARDSRIGTNRPTKKAGAPTAPKSQGSTTLESASASPVLLNA